ncbi:hypothetical protein LC085_06550 [Bacillus tianshenii]|uniref:hypothetical protein n=1 Tax=Sutcliffiella tianshenii TaxID=1463404 RepID=UPI001CD532E4|nr:hypothetical protein [Bacillus tianshenii]MCA1319569.1 hypothetical protein [Bacillus tianshenii]
MKRTLFLFILLIIFTIGCNASTTLKTLDQVTVQEMKDSTIFVDCTNIYDKPFWASSEEAIMYLCEVTVSDQTALKDELGNSLTLESIQIGAVLDVTFDDKTKLTKNEKRVVEAKEIILKQLE